jgi:hypothetical protein
MANLCVGCSAETSNPKFCSRSCAAKYNNKEGRSPKRKPEGFCKDCGVPNTKSRSRCRPCYIKWQSDRVLTDNVTLEEAVLRYDKHHPSSAFALVRTRARVIMKRSGRYGVCEWCGYDKHTEACHKKGISEFPPQTLLSEINSPDNLMALCPNCHWEHDKLDRRE